MEGGRGFSEEGNKLFYLTLFFFFFLFFLPEIMSNPPPPPPLPNNNKKFFQSPGETETKIFPYQPYHGFGGGVWVGLVR